MNVKSNDHPSKCDHPANRLLPFYLNGSLEEAEESEVREHVDACATCSAELDILSSIARGIEGQGLPILEEETSGVEGPASTRSAGGRGVRWSRPIAAALALPAAAGLWWAIRGFPGSGGDAGLPAALPHGALNRASETADSPLAEPATLWEIGGATRSAGGPPVFRLPREAASIVVRYPVPVNPDARHHVELVGPGGSLLARQETEPITDIMGRATTAFPARLFAEPGEYRIVVTQSAKGEEPRRYETRFSVSG